MQEFQRKFNIRQNIVRTEPRFATHSSRIEPLANRTDVYELRNPML